MKPIGKIQLGKQGLTENFIGSLRNIFKTHENVKISVLKSAGHDKKKVKEYSEKILEKLGKKYTARNIGFTISIKKWRKERG
ncbi:MAG: YhbY family RNA-binding protein [Nanoarchaeota archaeon]|nr:YhbY family RNA-binding protein [Nanoarchaeota archaeon]